MVKFEGEDKLQPLNDLLDQGKIVPCMTGKKVIYYMIYTSKDGK